MDSDINCCSLNTLSQLSGHRGADECQEEGRGNSGLPAHYQGLSVGTVAGFNSSREATGFGDRKSGLLRAAKSQLSCPAKQSSGFPATLVLS